MERGHRGTRAGYTIVETVVATLALTVIGSGYYAALSSGFWVVQTAREDLRATQIMMQKVEAARLCSWSQLTNFTFQERYDPLSAKEGKAGTRYTGTFATNEVSAIPGTASYKDKIRLITVTLYWTNYNGSKPVVHHRQTQTQAAKYGLQNYLWGGTL